MKVNSGRDYKHLSPGSIPVYGTGGYMLSVNEALSYEDDAIGIGRKGTIDKPYKLAAPFWTVDTLFYATPQNGIHLDFMMGVFQGIDWKQKDESTGVPSLSKNAINDTLIYIPSDTEQKAIGSLLHSLDNLITLHQRERSTDVNADLFHRSPTTTAWERRKLGEIAEIVGGGTPSTSISSFWDGDIDWYAPAEMEGKRYAVGSVRKITKLGLQHSSAKLLPADKTVLFTSRAGIGKMAILKRLGTTNQGFQSMIVKDDYSPYFVYSMGGIIKTKAEAVASGSTFLEISGKMLANLEITVPSKPEQDTIAKYFENLDDLITLHQRKFEKQNNIDFLINYLPTPQKSPSNTQASTLTWERRKLGEIAKEITRTDSESVAPVMMITASNGFIEQSERYAFNNAGESLKKYILLNKGELAYNHGASKIRPYGSCFALKSTDYARIPFVYHCFSVDGHDPEFLSIELNGKEVENQLRQIVSSGARMDGLLNISFGEYSSIIILLPKLAEQKSIASFFSSLDHLITLHQRE